MDTVKKFLILYYDFSIAKSSNSKQIVFANTNTITDSHRAFYETKLDRINSLRLKNVNIAIDGFKVNKKNIDLMDIYFEVVNLYNVLLAYSDPRLVRLQKIDLLHEKIDVDITTPLYPLAALKSNGLLHKYDYSIEHFVDESKTTKYQNELFRLILGLGDIVFYNLFAGNENDEKYLSVILSQLSVIVDNLSSFIPDIPGIKLTNSNAQIVDFGNKVFGKDRFLKMIDEVIGPKGIPKFDEEFLTRTSSTLSKLQSTIKTVDISKRHNNEMNNLVLYVYADSYEIRVKNLCLLLLLNAISISYTKNGIVRSSITKLYEKERVIISKLFEVYNTYVDLLSTPYQQNSTNLIIKFESFGLLDTYSIFFDKFIRNKYNQYFSISSNFINQYNNSLFADSNAKKLSKFDKLAKKEKYLALFEVLAKIRDDKNKELQPAFYFENYTNDIPFVTDTLYGYILKNIVLKTSNSAIKTPLDHKSPSSSSSVKLLYDFMYPFATLKPRFDTRKKKILSFQSLRKTSQIKALMGTSLKLSKNMHIDDDIVTLYDRVFGFDNKNDIHKKLVSFYEDMSGAVRVIVRTQDRDFIENSKSFDSSDENYGILRGLDGTISLEYEKKRITFGPFYSIVDLGAQNRDLTNIFHVNELCEMLFDQTSVVLFTYGFSGSGKTYSLFGNYNDPSPNRTYGLAHNFLESLILHRESSSVRSVIKLEKIIKLYGYVEGAGNMRGTFIDSIKEEDPLSFTQLNDAISRATSSNVDECKVKLNNIVATLLANKWDDSSDEIFPTKDEYVGGASLTPRPPKTIQMTASKPSRVRNIPHIPQVYSTNVNGAQPENSFLDRFIKTTPNNKDSSRGFLFLTFSIESEGRKNTFTLIDMAGSEDSYDLQTKVLPTYYFPQCDVVKKTCQPTNYLNSKKLQDKDIVIDKFAIAVDTTVQNTLKSIVAMLIKVMLYVQQHKEITLTEILDEIVVSPFSDLNLATSKNSSPFEKMFYDADRNFRRFSITLFYNILKISNFKSGKFAGFLCVDTEKTKGLLLRQVKKSDIEKYIDDVEPTKKIQNVETFLKSIKRTSFLVDPLIYPPVDNGNDSACMGTFSYGRIRNSAGKVRDVNAKPQCNVRFDEKNQSDILKTLICFLCAEYYAKLSSELSNIDIKEYEALLNATDDNILRNMNAKQFDTLQYNVAKRTFLNYVIETQNFTENVHVISAQNPYNLAEIFATNTSEENLEYTLKGLQNTSIIKKTPRQSTVDVDKKPYENKYIEQIFDSIKSTIRIGSKTISAPRNYFERVLREGFYINEVNNELVEYLLRKKDETNIGDAIPVDKNSSFDLTQIYLGNYDKFTRTCPTISCDRSSPFSTKLLDVFHKILPSETADAKFLLACNLRKEKDLKFRSGSIDALKLVEKLKST